MAVVNFNKRLFEKEIGKVDDKMENKISLFGTPVEEITNEEVKIEVAPNRPDLLSFQGFKRSFLAYLGRKTGIKKYPIKSPEKNYSVYIDPSVNNVRPFTSCAIIKGLKLDDEKIREIIEVQEKIHFTVGRKRKKLAIGIYPLERIKLPITYKAMNPKDIKFVPMDSEKEMSALEILKKHSKGMEYGHLLNDNEKFPAFMDSDKNILSMPPIINSDLTGKVTTATKEVFVECSGFDYNSLEKCINMLSTMFADMGGKIYQMNLKFKGRKKVSPNLEPEKMRLNLENANKLLGLSLNEKQAMKLLEKMGYGCRKLNSIEIPSWRTDILHEVDLIEDIAIAYGYDNFVPEIPEISTTGQESKKESSKRKISEILSGLGMLEVSSYHLTNVENQFKKMGTQKKDFVETEDSKTDYNILRKDLGHNLMRIFSENIDSEYPQKIFEIGRVFSLDAERKINESDSLSIAISPGNFTELKQAINYLSKMIDVDLVLKEVEDKEIPKYFVDGRVAGIFYKNKLIGYAGEIHPRILRNWKMKMPVALCEINLDLILDN